jgi:isoaspartyl peptidase/L-asparaginase-like protein (Ntn-hydrolase superfamily)
VADLGGDAGLIAVDAAGTVGAFFTSAAMSRAWRAGDGPLTVGVLPGDEAPVR